MKKLLSFVFVIVLLLSITACKNSQLSTRIAEPFSKILKNEQAFYTSYSKTNITLSDYNKTVWQYSLVDMDADGNDELAIMFEDGNIIILRQKDDKVLGYDFGLHSMYQINSDGSFLWNSDAGSIYGCSTLKFEDEQYKTNELWRVENDGNNTITYYVNGKTVTKNEFDALNEKRNKKSIEWNLLSEEN